MSHFVRESVVVNGKPLVFETGRLAKQAHGAVLVTYGESVVLVTAVSGDERPGIDFFPLTCDYVEKTFAAGQDPGRLLQARGAPARRGDPHVAPHGPPVPAALPRGLQERHAGHRDRPLERQGEPDRRPRDDRPRARRFTSRTSRGAVRSRPSASPASTASSSPSRRSSSRRRRDIDLIVACSKDAIVMVEGGAAEATEADVIDALMFAHETAQPILELIERMRAAVGKPKRTFERKTLPADVAAKVEGARGPGHPRPRRSSRRRRRATTRYKATKTKVVEAVTAMVGAEGFAKIEKLVKEEFEERKYHVVRNYVLSRAQAHRRARHDDDPPHRVRGGHLPARPRLGALPARRDAGRRRPRRWARRATSRRSTR